MFRWVAILLLLSLAWLGIKGGVDQWPQSLSLGQKVQTLTQFAYAIMSLVVAARMPAVPLFVRALWLASITTAAFLAPMVWGDTGWGSSLLAGVATLLIGLLLLWLLRLGNRRVEEAGS